MTKTVIVSGGSRGIGLAVVRTLLSKQYSVVAVSRTGRVVDPTLNSTNNFHSLQCDVADEAACISTVKKIASNSSNIYGLVNNAGITASHVFVRSSNDDYNNLFDVNVRGAVNLTRAVLRHSKMIQNRDGAIVNVGSVMAHRGTSGQVLYSASKSALIGFTRSLSEEYGRYNVRVNMVNPGFIETDMTKDLSESLRASVKERVAMKRFGSADEVASLVVYLLEATYITGQAVGVDGGM